MTKIILLSFMRETKFWYPDIAGKSSAWHFYSKSYTQHPTGSFPGRQSTRQLRSILIEHVCQPHLHSRSNVISIATPSNEVRADMILTRPRNFTCADQIKFQHLTLLKYWNFLSWVWYQSNRYRLYSNIIATNILGPNDIVFEKILLFSTAHIGQTTRNDS